MPTPPDPPTINVRPGVPADAQRIAEVHVQSWQAAYRGLLPDAYLDHLCAKRRVATWERLLHDSQLVIFVAEVDDPGVIGFASLSPCRDADASPNTAELSSLYLAPLFWGRGAGAALIREVIGSARSQRLHHLTLWVLASNDRARRFYEKCGFIPDGAEKTEHRSPDLVLHECRYRLDLPLQDRDLDPA